MALRVGSTVVHLGENAYYVPSSSKYDPISFGEGQLMEPCTVISLPKDATSKTTSQTLRDFAVRDDVWSPDFLSSTVLQSASADSEKSLDQDIIRLLEERGTQHIYYHKATETAELPQGPYFLRNGSLLESYRLYADTAGAFVVATVPADSEGTYKALDVAAYGETYPTALTVAVPSRLYFEATTDKPYAGKRIGVKDIIDLKGLKTGASSRAYTSFYPVKESNAEAVQSLINQGFVIVGKTKTTQFADSEWPTCDYIDYHAPFNPRGDGYLTPSGSSSGSASALASYDWLDFTIGSDSLGSARAPAAAQALFSMRPSLGATSTKGIIPYSPNFDTISGFARTASEFRTITQALYGKGNTTNEKRQKPTKLLYPEDYWPVVDSASQEVFDNFITKLEEFIGVERTPVNLNTLWMKTSPPGWTATLAEAFENVFEWTANPDQWELLLKPFIGEYKAKFGHQPILNPQLRFKIAYNERNSVTTEQHIEGLRRLAIYKKWFYEHVMPTATDGASDTLLVLPWTTGKPDYRDRYREGPQMFEGKGYFFYNIANYAEAPEIIIPAGTTDYISKLSGVKEQLPAAVGIIAAEGSDVWLAELISDLFEEQIISSCWNDPALQKILGKTEP